MSLIAYSGLPVREKSPAVEKHGFVRRRVGVGRSRKLPVASFKEYQRPAAIDGMFMHRSDPSDEDLVVATIKSRVSFAFEDNRRIREHRYAGIAGQRGNAFPFVAFRARELIGNLLLLLVEHIDGVA